MRRRPERLQACMELSCASDLVQPSAASGPHYSATAAATRVGVAAAAVDLGAVAVGAAARPVHDTPAAMLKDAATGSDVHATEMDVDAAEAADQPASVSAAGGGMRTPVRHLESHVWHARRLKMHTRCVGVDLCGHDGRWSRMCSVACVCPCVHVRVSTLI